MPDDTKKHRLPETPADNKEHTRIINAIELDLKAIDDNHRSAAKMQDFLTLDKHLSQEVEADRIANERAIIAIPLLNQYCANLEGELKQNKSFPEVYPSDKKASKATAMVLEGALRQILYENNAESILDQSGVSSIECGFGALSVDLRPGEEHKFDTEVIIKPEPDFASIIPDAYAEADDYSDGKHITKFFRLTKDDFEKQYPDFEMPSSEFFLNAKNDTRFEHWYTENTLSLAKFFEIVPKKEKWCKLSDGNECLEEEVAAHVKRDKEDRERREEMRLALIELQKQQQEFEQVQAQLQPPQGAAGQPQPAGLPPQAPAAGTAPTAGAPLEQQIGGEQEEDEPLHVVDTLTVESNETRYFIVTGHHILEGPTKWGSDYLPYLLELGKVRFIAKKRVVQGAVNKGVTGNRFLDKYFTEIADELDNRIKKKVMAQAGHIAGFENEWANSNKGDSAVLPVRVLEDSKMPVPVQMDNSRDIPAITSLLGQIQLCKGVISDAIGMHDSDVSGQAAADASGAAIENRQKPGDVNMYSFLDNHFKFVAQVAKVLLDMILQNWTNKRDIRVREIDGNVKRAMINVPAHEALEAVTKYPDLYSAMEQKSIEDFIRENGAEAEYNSLKEGRYDVRVKAGPPYQTAREENAVKFRIFLETIGRTPTPQNLLERYFAAKLMDGFEEYVEVLKTQCIAAGLIKPDEDEKQEVQETLQRQKAVQQHNPAFQLAQAKIQVETLKAQTGLLKEKTEQLKQIVQMKKLNIADVELHKAIEEIRLTPVGA